MLHLEIKPARVFCSYSHRDDGFRCELEAHLAPLARQNLITFWYDRRIVPGDDWREGIAHELDEAAIILLLISAYFISSDYCYKIELGRALERHKEGSAVVIPIFVRPCDREGLPFSNLQGLPSDDLSISEYENRDKAWAAVAKGVRQALKELTNQRHQQPKFRPEISTAERETYEATAYLRHLTAFHQKGSGFRAISLEAEINGQTEPLGDSLDTWAKGNFRPLLLLVGEPGSGKTWAFRQLAATLAEAVLRGDHLSPQPIYVPFHELESGGVAAIYKAIPEARGVLDKYKEGANTVLILDGIDEGTVDSIDDALQILAAVLKEIQANAGVALSARTRVAFDLLAGLKEHRYQPLLCRIRDSDTKPLHEYFAQQCLNLLTPAPAASAAIDLRPPALLEMLRQVLGRRSGGSPNQSELYDTFVSLYIRSAQERDKSLATMPPAVLWSFLKNLARQMFPFVTKDITGVQVDIEWSSKKFDIINGLAASGLLTINSREFISFSHISFFEFFFAKVLFDELLSWNAEHLSRSNLIYSYNVNRFLVPMLLEASPMELTQQAHHIFERLKQTAIRKGNRLLSQPILRKDFIDFAEDTGWRHGTGFGQWVVFSGPSGNLTASDGTIVPEQDHISLTKDSEHEDIFAVSLSWYDAYQFARWVGGSLPAHMETSPIANSHSPKFEWTSSWLNESESLIAVRHTNDGQMRGVNPDVRSSEIGFRVLLEK